MRLRFLIWILMLALVLSSCGEEYDYVLELGKETEALAIPEEEIKVIINKNSRTFHLDEECRYLRQMSAENRMDMTVRTKDELFSHGYKACSGCAKDDS